MATRRGREGGERWGNRARVEDEGGKARVMNVLKEKTTTEEENWKKAPSLYFCGESEGKAGGSGRGTLRGSVAVCG